MGRPKFDLTDVPLIPDADKIAELRREFFRALQPPEYLDLDEWADKYRVLPSETSSEYGQWRTDRFPFLRRIMKCLSPASPARMIIAMKGAQLGFTESAINWLLYIASANPGPCLYTQATEDAVEGFSKQKLAPSIAACHAVYHSLGAGKSKKLSDTILDKGFPGGFIALGPANSEKFTRSKSVRDAIADEEDSYAADSDHGGSPLKNIEKRQVNFPDRKFYRLSTPKIKETSTILPAYEFGSQEQYYVPCPHCNPDGHEAGNMFVIVWDQIRWSKKIDPKNGLPAEVWLECPFCAERIEETKKTWMLARGDWFSTKGGDGTRYRVAADVEIVSFHISSLYSPYGFFSWRDAVREWFEYLASKDTALLQVFINQTLGEPYSVVGQEMNFHALMQRAEEWPEGGVPRGGLVVTAGVDIQADRIEVSTVAWGLYEESWALEHVVLPGDTELMGNAAGMLSDGQPSVWLLLDQFLSKRYRHVTGTELPIEVTMIDSGFRGENVHVFCRLREGRRIYPCKGRDGWGYGYYQTTRKRHERFNTLLYTAYTDELKAKFYSMLQLDLPGPGYCHFPKRPDMGERYFKGLVSESRETKMVNGRPRLYWRCAPGVRNEPLDCRVYALMARLAYPVNLAARAELAGVSSPVVAMKERPAAMRAQRRRGSPGL